MPPVAITDIRWPALLAWCALAPLIVGLGCDLARRPRFRNLASCLILCGATVGLAAALVALCAAYDDLRSAATVGDVAGRPANRAWYALARSPALDPPDWAAFGRTIARATATALAMTLIIPLYSRPTTEARWPRAAARIVGAAAVALLAIQVVPQPAAPRARPEAWLQLHAAATGVVLALILAALSSDRSSSKTFITGLAFAAATAILTGLALAGWRPAQVTDWLHHPRDRAHAAAALAIPIAAAIAPLAPRARRRTAIISATLLIATLAVAFWTGALMLFDGSDQSDGIAELFRTRNPTVQLRNGP